MTASAIFRTGLVASALLGAMALMGCDRDQPDPGYPQQQYPQQQYPQQQYPQPQAYPQPQQYPQPQTYPQPTAPPPATTAPPAQQGTPTAIPGLMKMPDGTCQATLPSLDPNASPQTPITLPCPPGV